jgi:non-canonical poly(A) RNA polymerase PAPD5/7
MNNFFLSILQNSLKNQNWVKNVEFQYFNLIKVFTNENLENLNIEISIQEDKNYILNYIEIIKSYLNEYKILTPLILTLNTILKQANLHIEYFGGLSTYGLILMIVSYIQSKKDEYNENEENIIGKIFYGFLEHYGIIFDFQKYIIITYPPKNMEHLKENNLNYNIIKNIINNKLIIIDPINEKNIVEKKHIQFLNIKMAFMISFKITKEDCECGCHYGKAENEHDLFSIEHCILKRMFNSVKRYNESK